MKMLSLLLCALLFAACSSDTAALSGGGIIPQKFNTSTELAAPRDYWDKHVAMVEKTWNTIKAKYGEKHKNHAVNDECGKWRLQAMKTRFEYAWAANTNNLDNLAGAEANYNQARQMVEYWCGGGGGGTALDMVSEYVEDHGDMVVEDLTRVKVSTWDVVISTMKYYVSYLVWNKQMSAKTSLKTFKQVIDEADDPDVKAGAILFLMFAREAVPMPL